MSHLPFKILDRAIKGSVFTYLHNLYIGVPRRETSNGPSNLKQLFSHMNYEQFFTFTSSIKFLVVSSLFTKCSHVVIHISVSKILHNKEPQEAD